MNSLEKCMFFIPNRLFVDRDEMFVSFNIASIPTDMEINRLTLHVPLKHVLESKGKSSMLIEEIDSGWDVALVSQGFRPAHSKRIAKVQLFPSQEAIVDLSEYEAPWRFKSIKNHGVYVKLSGSKADFFAENVPYLIVATI